VTSAQTQFGITEEELAVFDHAELAKECLELDDELAEYRERLIRGDLSW
jgi:ribosomal protein L29